MKIGELIKLERESKFITVQSVAETLGVHRNSIYYMEKGEIKIQPAFVVKLNKLFECDLNKKLDRINKRIKIVTLNSHELKHLKYLSLLNIRIQRLIFDNKLDRAKHLLEFKETFKTKFINGNNKLL
jgi:predicted transcriptional regulator